MKIAIRKAGAVALAVAVAADVTVASIAAVILLVVVFVEAIAVDNAKDVTVVIPVEDAMVHATWDVTAIVMRVLIPVLVFKKDVILWE